MLSILIPTFNYNVFPLVKELYNQCKGIENLNFEIIVNDDASELTFDNDSIKELPNCFYYKQNKNQGLSASRNFLIQQATQSWCLFLDDDIWPTTDSFILNYTKASKIESNASVFFGGLEYTKQRPKNDELLRWLYGNKHEALDYEKRLQQKPTHFLSSNVLIKKSIFKQVTYASEINSYGYEDLIFNLKIIENKIKIKQINNPVFHEKLDTSELFLNKTQQALENLSKSINLNLLPKNATGISKMYYQLIGLRKLVEFVFKVNQKWMIKILVGKNTNLKLFNIYRLGYFFSIHK